MSCFWTDLVGATQSGCEPAVGLRLAFNTTASEGSAVAPVVDIIAAFTSAHSGSPTAPHSISAGLDSSAVYRRIVAESGLFSTSSGMQGGDVTFSAGFSSQEGRYITTYAEFLAPNQTLAVVGAWAISYDSCGQTFTAATLTPYSVAGAAAVVDASGLLVVTPPTAFTGGGSFGIIYDLVVRVTGTVNGENGASEAADFYIVSGYDFCF